MEGPYKKMVVAISDRSSLCCLGYCPSNVSFTPEYVLRSQLIGQKVFTLEFLALPMIASISTRSTSTACLSQIRRQIRSMCGNRNNFMLGWVVGICLSLMLPCTTRGLMPPLLFSLSPASTSGTMLVSTLTRTWTCLASAVSQSWLRMQSGAKKYQF